MDENLTVILGAKVELLSMTLKIAMLTLLFSHYLFTTERVILRRLI